MSQEETIEILEELLNSVKSRGYKKTLTVLKTEKMKKVNLTTFKKIGSKTLTNQKVCS